VAHAFKFGQKWCPDIDMEEMYVYEACVMAISGGHFHIHDMARLTDAF
jgi:hypothetical protein